MIKKSLPWILIATLSVALGVQWFELRGVAKSLKTSNQLIEKRLNTFNEELGRAETRLHSSEALLKLMIREVPDDIRKDISDVVAEIQAVGTARLSHETRGGGRVLRPQVVDRREGRDRREAIQGPDVHVKREDEVPNPTTPGDPQLDWTFSDWRLNASLGKDDVFTYSLKQKFDFVLVEAARGNGAATYIRMWELDSSGDRITPPLTVEDFKVIRMKPKKAHFRAFNPKLEISLATSTPVPEAKLRLAPELSLSVMSHGETADDLAWRFLRVGVSYDGATTGISAAPASYNLGKHLPLVSNVWLSPFYIWDGRHGGGVSLGGTL